MRAVRFLAASTVVVAALGVGTSFFLLNTVIGQGSDAASTSDLGSCSAVINAASGTADLDQEQLSNATTIVSSGIEMRVPVRGLVIAVATALQESALRNLSYGDRDSVGLFQQRPSSGWGTVGELTDPPTASRKFYQALLKVPSWQSLSLTVAAQAVQRSAFPSAYAKWEALSQTLVGRFVRDNAIVNASTSLAGIGCGDVVGASLPNGIVGEMLQVTRSQLGKPYVWGATGPDAFDCSGLIVYAWRIAGFPLRVRTSEQMYRVSDRVPTGSERVGDLLFGDFSTNGPGHVMVVISPGIAIEAPHAGDVVKTISYDVNAWTIGRLNSSAFLGSTVPS